jgi:hypothetical protein
VVHVRTRFSANLNFEAETTMLSLVPHTSLHHARSIFTPHPSLSVLCDQLQRRAAYRLLTASSLPYRCD